MWPVFNWLRVWFYRNAVMSPRVPAYQTFIEKVTESEKRVFSPEFRGGRFLRNTDNFLPDDMLSHPERYYNFSDIFQFDIFLITP